MRNDFSTEVTCKKCEKNFWIELDLYEPSGNTCDECLSADDEPDQFRTDLEADADALASAGWGTDEDYGG